MVHLRVVPRPLGLQGGGLGPRFAPAGAMVIAIVIDVIVIAIAIDVVVVVIAVGVMVIVIVIVRAIIVIVIALAVTADAVAVIVMAVIVFVFVAVRLMLLLLLLWRVLFVLLQSYSPYFSSYNSYAYLLIHTFPFVYSHLCFLGDQIWWIYKFLRLPNYYSYLLLLATHAACHVQ